MKITRVAYLPPMHELLENSVLPGSGPTVTLIMNKQSSLLESYTSVPSPTTTPYTPTLLIDGVNLCPYIHKSDRPAITANLDALVRDGILVPQHNRNGFHLIYNKRYKLSLPDNPEFRLDVYYEPRDNDRALLSLSFNPAKMGDNDWGSYQAFGYQVFNGEPSKHLSKSHISLIDVAIDIPGVNINDLSISSTHYSDHDRKRKAGQLVYESFGARSSLSRIKVYNKAKLLKHQNKTTTPGELTRFETTIKGYFPLNDLRNLPNRLTRLTVSQPHASKILTANDRNFIDAIQVHGAQEVIDRYSDNKTRTSKRQLLKKHGHSYIDFEQIWEQQWPKACRSLRRKIAGNKL